MNKMRTVRAMKETFLVPGGWGRDQGLLQGGANISAVAPKRLL